MENQYYAVSLNDTEKLKQSSSGGMAYAVCERVIQNGGVVYGVRYSEDYLSAQYVRINNLKDIVWLSGSKYITTSKKLSNGKGVFQSIYEDIIERKKVLFIGVPCDVGNLYKYLEKKQCYDYTNLWTIDFICQGPLKAEIQKEYIAFLEKKYKSKINSFSVRYKNPFWEQVCLRAVFENGKEHIKPLYETDFGRAFMILGQESCYQCKYKGENHCSDITIGDFWGLNPGDSGYNKFGTSVAVIHTEKGNMLMKSLESIRVTEHDEEKALGKNPMYYNARDRHKKFYQFKNNCSIKGLHKTVFLTRSIPSKIKYLLQLMSGKRPY